MNNLEGPAERLNCRGDDGGYGKAQDWRKHVKCAAELARINFIAPDTLRKCGATCWNAYQEMLGKPDKLVCSKALFKEIKKAIPLLEAIEKPTVATRKALGTLQDFLRHENVREPAWTDWAMGQACQIDNG